MISLNDCEDRWLYRIRSRNLSHGVFNKANNGFIGIRAKFGNRYLDTEYHLDTGSPFGTAWPVKKLKLLPSEIACNDRDKALFSWLEKEIDSYRKRRK